MLESEYEELRIIHPEYARRWDAFLETWADKKGFPESFCTWGLWRWRALPPKMRELCKSKGIIVNDDYTLRTVPVRMTKDTFDKKEGTTMEPKMEKPAGAGFAVNEIRKDFPILGDIIYLDNAATSFSPEPVIEAMVEFEHRYRANVGRGVHRFTQISSQRYWHAHDKVAQFIGGKRWSHGFYQKYH